MVRLLSTPGVTRDHLQFSTRGEWEKALVFDPSRPSVFEDWLADADEDVALEAVFSDGSGALKGFAGFRRHMPVGPTRIRYWQSVLAATAAVPSDPRGTVRTWLTLLGHSNLLSDEPDSVEFGVFNQWRSAGSILLLGPALSRNLTAMGPTWLRKGATAPICRESAWHLPEKFWLAEVVSRQKQDRYFLEEDLLPH